MAADVEIAETPLAVKAQTSDVKLSRYRSVRKAQLKAREDPVPPLPTPPPIPETNPDMEAVKRSMSRYKRTRAPAQVAAPQKTGSAPDGRETTPRSKPGAAQRIDSPHEHHYGHHTKAAHPYPQYPIDATKSKLRGLMALKDEEDEDVPLGTLMEQQARRKEKAGTKTTEGEQVLAGERARYEKIKTQQRAERAEREKQLEEERRKKEEAEEAIRKLEREKAEEEERARQAKREEEERARRAKEEDEERERRNREEEKERAMQERFEAKQRAKDEKLARKRRPTMASASSRPDWTRPSSREGEGEQSPESSRRVGGFFRRRKEDETPKTSHSDERRPKTSHATPPKFELTAIKHGGGGLLPLADAPLSGVYNAGRRVRIKFGPSEINLPVDDTTTAQQLIKSTSNIMSEGFNPRAAIMLEYFWAEGLYRPIRMYELIRRIMDSWESDKYNFLVIEESSPEDNKELYETHAPRHTDLVQFEGELRHQNAHGKWEKRWVVIRTDGQVTGAKHSDNKGAANICNLSELEIYRPVESKKRSKKIVMTLKSQHKSTMFLDKSTYMYHFYTEDKKVAEEFFRVAQAWRSYNIVTRFGPGGNSNMQEASAGTAQHHNRSQSAESHFMLGSFNTLGLDFSTFGKSTQAEAPKEPVKKSFDENRPLASLGLTLPSAAEHSRAMHARQLSVRRNQSKVPPTSMRQPLPSRPGGRDDALQALNGISERRSVDNQDRFRSGSILSPSHYDEQKRRMEGRSGDHGSRRSGGGGLQRNNSVRSTYSAESHTLGRRESTRRGVPQPGDFGKPLIDFTPQYKEPPQFAKRGHGFRPDRPSSGGLIENATSYENPLGLPGNDDWRARPTTSGAALDQNHGINRSKSTRRDHYRDNSEAFTGGALAYHRSGQGAQSTGHGVMSGNHANGPMLNMNEGSAFADGSLLQQMEKANLGHHNTREPWRES